MNRKITLKDNIYLMLPFVIMLVLTWSSSMSYETQSLISPLENILASRPFEDFLSRFEFTYGGSLVSVASRGYFSFIEFFMRKGAHFFSFFLLGFFWQLGLRKRVREEWLVLTLSILLCIGFAAFDEFRQSFHPARTGLMADVILDAAGAIAGVGIAWFLSKKKIIR
jgi:VanZ family protein